MIDPGTMQQIKDAFTLVRESIGLVKDAKGVLPAPQQKTIDEALEKANRATALAEAQAAQVLGFKLHDCTFPPQIMLAVQTPHGEEKRCPSCGHTTRFNAPLDALRTIPLGPSFRRR